MFQTTNQSIRAFNITGPSVKPYLDFATTWVKLWASETSQFVSKWGMPPPNCDFYHF